MVCLKQVLACNLLKALNLLFHQAGLELLGLPFPRAGIPGLILPCQAEIQVYREGKKLGLRPTEFGGCNKGLEPGTH